MSASASNSSTHRRENRAASDAVSPALRRPRFFVDASGALTRSIEEQLQAVRGPPPFAVRPTDQMGSAETGASATSLSRHGSRYLETSSGSAPRLTRPGSAHWSSVAVARRVSPSQPSSAYVHQRKQELLDSMLTPVHNLVGLTDHFIQRPQFHYRPRSAASVSDGLMDVSARRPRIPIATHSSSVARDSVPIADVAPLAVPLSTLDHFAGWGSSTSRGADALPADDDDVFFDSPPFATQLVSSLSHPVPPALAAHGQAQFTAAAKASARHGVMPRTFTRQTAVPPDPASTQDVVPPQMGTAGVVTSDAHVPVRLRELIRIMRDSPSSLRAQPRPAPAPPQPQPAVFQDGMARRIPKRPQSAPKSGAGTPQRRGRGRPSSSLGSRTVSAQDDMMMWLPRSFRHCEGCRTPMIPFTFYGASAMEPSDDTSSKRNRAKPHRRRRRPQSSGSLSEGRRLTEDEGVSSPPPSEATSATASENPTDLQARIRQLVMEAFDERERVAGKSFAEALLGQLQALGLSEERILTLLLAEQYAGDGPRIATDAEITPKDSSGTSMPSSVHRPHMAQATQTQPTAQPARHTVDSGTTMTVDAEAQVVTPQTHRSTSFSVHSPTTAAVSCATGMTVDEGREMREVAVQTAEFISTTTSVDSDGERHERRRRQRDGQRAKKGTQTERQKKQRRSHKDKTTATAAPARSRHRRDRQSSRHSSDLSESGSASVDRQRRRYHKQRKQRTKRGKTFSATSFSTLSSSASQLSSSRTLSSSGEQPQPHRLQGPRRKTSPPTHPEIASSDSRDSSHDQLTNGLLVPQRTASPPLLPHQLDTRPLLSPSLSVSVMKESDGANAASSVNPPPSASCSSSSASFRPVEAEPVESVTPSQNTAHAAPQQAQAPEDDDTASSNESADVYLVQTATNTSPKATGGGVATVIDTTPLRVAPLEDEPSFGSPDTRLNATATYDDGEVATLVTPPTDPPRMPAPPPTKPQWMIPVLIVSSDDTEDDRSASGSHESQSSEEDDETGSGTDSDRDTHRDQECDSRMATVRPPQDGATPVSDDADGSVQTSRRTSSDSEAVAIAQAVANAQFQSQMHAVMLLHAQLARSIVQREQMEWADVATSFYRCRAIVERLYELVVHENLARRYIEEDEQERWDDVRAASFQQRALLPEKAVATLTSGHGEAASSGQDTDDGAERLSPDASVASSRTSSVSRSSSDNATHQTAQADASSSQRSDAAAPVLSAEPSRQSSGESDAAVPMARLASLARALEDIEKDEARARENVLFAEGFTRSLVYPHLVEEEAQRLREDIEFFEAMRRGLIVHEWNVTSPAIFCTSSDSNTSPVEAAALPEQLHDVTTAESVDSPSSGPDGKSEADGENASTASAASEKAQSPIATVSVPIVAAPTVTSADDHDAPEEEQEKEQAIFPHDVSACAIDTAAGSSADYSALDAEPVTRTDKMECDSNACHTSSESNEAAAQSPLPANEHSTASGHVSGDSVHVVDPEELSVPSTCPSATSALEITEPVDDAHMCKADTSELAETSQQPVNATDEAHAGETADDDPAPAAEMDVSETQSPKELSTPRSQRMEDREDTVAEPPLLSVTPPLVEANSPAELSARQNTPDSPSRVEPDALDAVEQTSPSVPGTDEPQAETAPVEDAAELDTPRSSATSSARSSVDPFDEAATPTENAGDPAFSSLRAHEEAPPVMTHTAVETSANGDEEVHASATLQEAHTPPPPSATTREGQREVASLVQGSSTTNNQSGDEQVPRELETQDPLPIASLESPPITTPLPTGALSPMQQDQQADEQGPCDEDELPVTVLNSEDNDSTAAAPSSGRKRRQPPVVRKRGNDFQLVETEEAGEMREHTPEMLEQPPSRSSSARSSPAQLAIEPPALPRQPPSPPSPRRGSDRDTTADVPVSSAAIPSPPSIGATRLSPTPPAPAKLLARANGSVSVTSTGTPSSQRSWADVRPPVLKYTKKRYSHAAPQIRAPHVSNPDELEDDDEEVAEEGEEYDDGEGDAQGCGGEEGGNGSPADPPQSGFTTPSPVSASHISSATPSIVATAAANRNAFLRNNKDVEEPLLRPPTPEFVRVTYRRLSKKAHAEAPLHNVDEHPPVMVQESEEDNARATPFPLPQRRMQRPMVVVRTPSTDREDFEDEEASSEDEYSSGSDEEGSTPNSSLDRRPPPYGVAGARSQQTLHSPHLLPTRAVTSETVANVARKNFNMILSTKYVSTTEDASLRSEDIHPVRMLELKPLSALDSDEFTQ